MRKKCFFRLYRFELLKILKNKIAVITFLFLFGYAFVQGEFEVSGNVDPARLKAYATLSYREVDDAFLQELEQVSDEMGNIPEEYAAYKPFLYLVEDYLGYGAPIKDLSVEHLNKAREQTIREAYELAKLSDGEIAYWQDKEQQIEKPLIYHDIVVAGGVLEGTCNYMIMLLMIITLALSSVFAMETQRRTDAMIRSTIYGRKDLYFAKILAGISFILCCAVIFLVTFYAYIGINWGFSGMDVSVLNDYPFTQMDLTMWQLAGILLLLVFLGSILVSAFTLFISGLTRNALATMGIVIGTYMGLFALSAGIPEKLRPLSQFISLLPQTLVSSRLVYEFRLVKLGKYFMCYEVAPVLYILLTIFLILGGYVLYRKHEIRSN